MLASNGTGVTLANVLSAHAIWRATKGQDGVRATLTEALVVDQPFTEQNFSFVDLGELDLSGRSLENSDLSYADLSKCRCLTEDKLPGTNLRGAMLPKRLRTQRKLSPSTNSIDM